MINIYDYVEPSQFLKDHLAEKKKLNSSFSLRSWAKLLGMKSHGPLHAILNQQRGIPKKLVPSLIQSLKLSKKDAKYFEALVDFQRSKTLEEKDFHREKLESLSPTPLREVNDLEAYKYITDPVQIILAEMTQLKNFKNDPAWIKKHFRINLNLRDIEIIIERLLKLGVVQEHGTKLLKRVEHIYTKFEVLSDTIQDYHKVCSEMAITEISKQDILEREFNAVAFNIKMKDLPKIKESMREFINQLVEEYEAPPHKGDETYQLNLQFFSLTK
jgi:uncharacterized protein (TIGR02147 family)